MNLYFFDFGSFVVFNEVETLHIQLFNNWIVGIQLFNCILFNRVELKDERIEVSFSSIQLNWIHKVERWDKLNFTMWNFFIQVKFHYVKFLHSNWISLREISSFNKFNFIPFNRVEMKDERVEFENMINGLNNVSTICCYYFDFDFVELFRLFNEFIERVEKMDNLIDFFVILIQQSWIS